MILTAYWIRVASQDLFEIDSNGLAPGAYKSIYLQSKYIKLYLEIASFRIIVASMVLMSYFEFSAKLSMFYEVIKSAIVDILFFLAIFFFNTAIFGLIGHLIFGQTEKDVSSLDEAMFTCFLVTVGEKNPLLWDTTFSFLRALYAILFVVIKVFLLNMFIAVVIAHYIEFYIELGDEGSLYDVFCC